METLRETTFATLLSNANTLNHYNATRLSNLISNMILKNILMILFSSLILSINPEKENPLESNSRHFIIRVQDVFVSNAVQKEVRFYCLLDISKEDLRGILGRVYVSRYSFYDTLCKTANAKGILDYWLKYWSNSCNKGHLNLSGSSPLDSVLNSRIVSTLHDTLSYSFMQLNIKNGVGQYIGIAEVDSLDYCNVFYRDFWDLPSDTIVILKNGFNISKVQIVD